MSSNLKVNTILPSAGTAIGIGTAGGSITITNGRLGVGTDTPLQRLHIRGEGEGNHLLYLQAGDTICDIIQSDNGGSTRLRSANGSFYVWTGGDGNSSTGANGSPAIHVNTSLETKFYNTIKVVDKIEHDTDSDTALRFPAEDTFSIETGGSEKLRITGVGTTAGGLFLVGTNDTGYSGYYTTMTVGDASGANSGITIAASPTGYSRVHFADANSGAARYAGFIAYYHTDDAILFGTNNSGSEKVRITSTGAVTKPQQPYVRINGITNTNGSGSSNNGTATTQGNITYSNGRVTAQVEGDYLITFASISDSGTGRVDGHIRVNGSNIVNILTSNNGTGYRQKSASIVYHLDVNDYVEWSNADWYVPTNTTTQWKTASVYMLG